MLRLSHNTIPGVAVARPASGRAIRAKDAGSGLKGNGKRGFGPEEGLFREQETGTAKKQITKFTD
jgi:hypothetical protein